MPNSVTTIDMGAFFECTGLTSITIPDSVTEIGTSTFSQCTGLTSITLPKHLYSIGTWAFGGCTALTSVTIPSGVTKIEEIAFKGCTGLTSITIQNPVPPFLEYGVFKNVNTKLIRLIVPKGSVNAYRSDSVWNEFQIVEDTVNYSTERDVLFNKGKTELIRYPEGKSGLYKIPNSVTFIGNRAFVGCVGLKNVTIPNSVTTIGEYAFYGCTGLRSLTVKNPIPPQIPRSAFEEVDTSRLPVGDVGVKSVNLFVPKGSIDAYRSAGVWNDFESIEEIPDTGVWIALGILSALVLFVAVFVVVKKSK